jgi:hypothetical protein
MSVSGDVSIIVEFNEIAAQQGKKHPDHQPEQQQAKEDFVSRPNDARLFNGIFQTFQFNRPSSRSSIPK